MIGSLDRMELVMHLRKRGIRDTRVLQAMQETPREMFIGEDFAQEAYADTALPIECGQTISQPFVVAYMTEQLAPEAEDKVLEAGTGSGYQTAILARLCRHVYTIERHRLLQEAAEQRFRRLQLANITSMVGDGWLGWPEHAPFGRVIVTAAAETMPQELVEQLAAGGCMILPLGETLDSQRLVRVDKTAKGLIRKNLLPVRFVPLVHGCGGNT